MKSAGDSCHRIEVLNSAIKTDSLSHFDHNFFLGNNLPQDNSFVATQPNFQTLVLFMALLGTLNGLVNKLPTLEVLMALFSSRPTKFNGELTNW